MIRWLVGDCREVLATLPAQSVHCVVTSPPYWGLREYGNGDKGIGLEATFAEYLANLADVFAAVWRVLRDDGTLWLNMGDAYAGSSMSGGVGNGTLAGTQHGERKNTDLRFRHRKNDGFKPKDLIGQPWRVAFMLQDAGWYLRSDIIWAKPNPMPESVQDRPTKSHEYIFLLTKQPRYFYDAEAIREKHSRDWWNESVGPDYNTNGDRNDGGKRKGNGVISGRNKRSVWTISTQPYSAAHFATFPPALARTCIQAGTSLHGCCAACGAPWRRVVERQFEQNGPVRAHIAGNQNGRGWEQTPRGHTHLHTTGWQPSCTCKFYTPKADLPAPIIDNLKSLGLYSQA